MTVFVRSPNVHSNVGPLVFGMVNDSKQVAA